MTQIKRLKTEKWTHKGKNKSKESDFSIPQYNNPLSMCIPSFKILAIIVPEKTDTKNLTELRSYVITELRTDQIQYSPTFSRGYKKT